MYFSRQGIPTTSQSEETRIWQRRDGRSVNHPQLFGFKEKYCNHEEWTQELAGTDGIQSFLTTVH